MAGKIAVIFMIATALILPLIASATDYTVGDDQGWMLGVDYTAWAKDKVFQVGDKLIFNYDNSKHDVAKVNGTGFKACTAPADSNNIMTTGSDQVELKVSGKKWYICTKAGHCDKGMKLVIAVSEYAEGPGPSPPAGSNGLSNKMAIKFQYLIRLTAAVVMVILF